MEEFARFLDETFPAEPGSDAQCNVSESRTRRLGRMKQVDDFTLAEVLVLGFLSPRSFPRKVYASEFKTGACFLRPYMLGFRQDFGYSGMHEPEEYLLLTQIILQEGFLFLNLLGFEL